jgi:hypothetical protein
MILRSEILTISLILLFSFSIENSKAQPVKWEKLGTRIVNYSLDRDIIPVTANRGGFTKLKVEVIGGAINMHKMIIVYGIGAKDEIPLRHNFNNRSSSRLIDLKGGKRMIKEIVFVYDTKGLRPRKAVVNVYGRH